MSDLGKPPQSAFWDFTLSIYRRDGVSPALISLQDQLGLDVNFLLFCLFAGTRGHALGDTDFARLEAAAAPLRQNLIHPLRQVRRWLKEQTLIGKESADAIRRAVEMPAEEQRARMSRMHETVREHNIYRWAGLLLGELSRIPEEPATNLAAATAGAKAGHPTEAER